MPVMAPKDDKQAAEPPEGQADGQPRDGSVRLVAEDDEAYFSTGEPWPEQDAE
jgi:hypothetical protein